MPMGGFKRYGFVHDDFIMLRGTLPGAVSRLISMRRCLVQPSFPDIIEHLKLKFIDTGLVMNARP